MSKTTLEVRYKRQGGHISRDLDDEIRNFLRILVLDGSDRGLIIKVRKETFSLRKSQKTSIEGGYNA